MAELTTNENAKNKGVARMKKLSTRVDLTPMVDLGFLLITFFIFTTTLSKPNVMKLNVPKDSTDSLQTPAARTMTLILDDNNRIFYYEGDESGKIEATSYVDVRNVLLQKKQMVYAKYGSKAGIIILIKPTQKAVYKNIVDMIDEMTIDGISNFVLMDISEGEHAIVANKT